MKRNDSGISPIIATILLIAATVVLGVTIYAATTGFGAQTPQARGAISFRAIEYDSDGSGGEDTLRFTYLEGPENADVRIQITSSAGAAVAHGCPGTWDVGDSCTVDAADVSPGRYSVTVTWAGTVVVDTALDVDE